MPAPWGSPGGTTFTHGFIGESTGAVTPRERCPCQEPSPKRGAKHALILACPSNRQELGGGGSRAGRGAHAGNEPSRIPPRAKSAAPQESWGGRSETPAVFTRLRRPRLIPWGQHCTSTAGGEGVSGPLPPTRTRCRNAGGGAAPPTQPGLYV